ncbi:MAG: beta-N-acetylhexosaminidase [Pseudomonadota bacterium]
MPRSLIVGLAGTSLRSSEQRFLTATQPAGVILFRRNIETRAQVKRLTEDVRSAIGADCLILVDEEGGRVQRLRPPAGRLLPAAARHGETYQDNPGLACDVAKLIARLTAHDLREIGINTNCAPVADLRFPGAHDIVGDRAYGNEIDAVVTLAGAVASGLSAGGVLPVLKHIPGHGRARCDSHHALPVVDAPHEALSKTDFAPFNALNAWPAAMTAHVVYSAIDSHAPATISATIICDVVRGEIGFDGLLMTDDLSMKALRGTLPERAASALSAGCDIALHCNGKLHEMEAVAEVCGPMSGVSVARFKTAFGTTKKIAGFDQNAAMECLAKVLAGTHVTSEQLSRLDPTA